MAKLAKKGQQESDVPEISSEGSRVWLLRNQMLERGMVSGSRKNKNQEEEKTLQNVSRILIEMPLFPKNIKREGIWENPPDAKNYK